MIKKILILFISLFFTYCSKEKKIIENGDEVLLHFKIKNKYGMRVDDSRLPCGDLPLRIIAGKGYLIKGFDDSLIGMIEGERKTKIILPEYAYRDKKLFYLDFNKQSKFLINSNDTLTIEIEILKVIKANSIE